MSYKFMEIIQIVFALLTFVAAIVLTHDTFDDFESRDTVLIVLTLINVCLALYNYIRSKRQQNT